MVGAIVREDIVESFIILDEAQIEELSAALGCEIVDAAPYGLVKGDLRTPAGWTRNVNGEQVILELLEPEANDGYTKAMEKVSALEEQQAHTAENAANLATEEALAILTGEVEA